MARPISEEEKTKILDKYMLSKQGRAKFASQMIMPLRSQRDYKSVARKAFLVHQLAMGAIPLYDRDIDLEAYIIGEEGENVVKIAKARRIIAPLLEISVNPEASAYEIQQRRYDLILRMIDKGKSQIQLTEDARAFTVMNAVNASPTAPNPAIPVIAPVSPAVINDAYGNIDRWRVDVVRSFWHSKDYVDIRKFGRDVFDPETQQVLINTGLRGVLWGAQVIVTPQAPQGRVYICGEKEMFGRIPVRQEMTVISADRPWDRVIGFSIWESLSFLCHNPYALQVLEVSR